MEFIKLIDQLSPLDSHAHIHLAHSSEALSETGAVLAMTLSLDEAARAVDRSEPTVAWGVGCHPRIPKAQNKFDQKLFAELVERAAFVGEIGLDTGSRVPIEIQLRNFRQSLEVVREFPRFVSIHSYQATGLVLQELRESPVSVPVLHWWTGTAEETTQAVSLGCYFSIHSAVARRSQFRTRVPPDRILVESDHGYNDPPAAIPCRIEWVEHLVGQQLKMSIRGVRFLAWCNLGRIIQDTDTWKLFPQSFSIVLQELNRVSAPERKLF